MRILVRVTIDDRVEHDIAIDPGDMDREYYPTHLHGHAKLLCQSFAELELEAALVAGLARERQRVRVSANEQPAALLDRFERTRCD